MGALPHGYVRLKSHVYVRGRGAIRYCVHARDTTHVWVRKVGLEGEELERLTVNQIEVIQ